jgi:hypothetical protein
VSVLKSTGKEQLRGQMDHSDDSCKQHIGDNSYRICWPGNKNNGANQPNYIRLIEAKNSLDEVVVVGYGTRKKSDVTGAISSVTEQAIKEIPAANLTQALQGQAAGIDIQKNGGK